MFTNKKWTINVKTVGEAVKELSLLDPSIPMDQGYDGNGTDIVVMNIDYPDIHIHFDDGGQWPDDE